MKYCVPDSSEKILHHFFKIRSKMAGFVINQAFDLILTPPGVTPKGHLRVNVSML